jgi:predicted TIM-barrel fold metal-dependent hydrolase
MNIIDPHLHLFNLELGDYHWLNANNPPFWPDKNLINQSFIEQDILLHTPLTLSGFIHIEAGFDNNQPWREIDWLEQHCQKPFSSIAAVDLTTSTEGFSNQIKRLLDYHSTVGVRHILDEQALTLLTNKQVQQNFTLLDKYGLIFEVQMPLTDHATVNALCKVISDNTNSTFIINHSGLPPQNIQTIEWQRWQSNLLKIALYPHTAIKCSGWEMVDRQYRQNTEFSKTQPQWLDINLTVCFNTFGEDRMMLASNFPLCLFSHKNYQQYWLDLLSCHFVKQCSEQKKSALFYDNALKYYTLACNTTG